MPQITQAEIQYEMQHVQDNRGPQLVAALAVNFTLAAIAVLLRLGSRYISRSRLLADDCTCIAAMIIVIGQLIDNLIGVHLGAGKHVILLEKPEAFAKVVLASEVFYVLGTALVKFSFLFLYNRLFGSNHRFRRILWACGTFVAAYSLVEVLVIIFQCRPVNAAWDLRVQGYCVNLALGAEIVGSINVVMDFLTLFLPIPMVWSLKMKKKWKFQLIGIFLLGSFVCVGSIVRVSTVHKLSLVDATWVDVDSAIWAMVENCIGIVSACLPTLRPLFNLIAHGHHCSASQGYCSRCSRNRSGIMPSDNWPSKSGDETERKIPETATWASQSRRFFGSIAAGRNGSTASQGGGVGPGPGPAGSGLPAPVPTYMQPHSAFSTTPGFETSSPSPSPSPSLPSPPPRNQHENIFFGGNQSSDEESLRLPKPNVQILK